jgi:hypothetical protein
MSTLERDASQVAPKCPYCNSGRRPSAVQQEYDGTTVLVLHCPSCGAILAAADFRPHYPFRA